jgi:hypothetical protein
VKKKISLWVLGLLVVVLPTYLNYRECTRAPNVARSEESALVKGVREACWSLDLQLSMMLGDASRQSASRLSEVQTRFVAMAPLIRLCTAAEVELGVEDVETYSSLEIFQQRVEWVKSKIKEFK